MRKQQRGDAVRRLFGGEMAYARQLLELIGRIDKLVRPLRGHPADSVVGVTPDEENGDLDGANGGTDGAAGAIPVSAASIVSGLPSTATYSAIAGSGTLLALSRSRSQRESSARMRAVVSLSRNHQ